MRGMSNRQNKFFQIRKPGAAPRKGMGQPGAMGHKQPGSFWKKPAAAPPGQTGPGGKPPRLPLSNSPDKSNDPT